MDSEVEKTGLSLALSKTRKTGLVVSKPNYKCVVVIHQHFTNTFKNELTVCLENKLLKIHDRVILKLCCFTRRKLHVTALSIEYFNAYCGWLHCNQPQLALKYLLCLLCFGGAGSDV